MTRSPDTAAQSVALIMSGGGARAAYQVGVLRAIAKMLPQRSRNPFPIICGTSAGAINAASLASNIDRFDHAVSRLARAWGNLHVGHVYRADLLGIARILSRCLSTLLTGQAGCRARRPGPAAVSSRSQCQVVSNAGHTLDAQGVALRSLFLRGRLHRTVE